MPHSISKPNVLVAALNWGLGHATRCIPIINALQANNYNPILASDGAALALWKKEFPHLEILELPSYKIEYPEKGSDFKWKMLKNMPTAIDAMLQEKKIVKKWVKQFELSGIISDNRLGVFSKKVPSVFITHQLNVLSGSTSWLSGKLHRRIIKKFDECWIPDYEQTPNLSGKLGHLRISDFNLRYLGPLSRFEKQNGPFEYDLLVLLSGPEPQRTLLEKRLLNELQLYGKRVLVVCGKPEETQQKRQMGNVSYVNYMLSSELQTAINQSEIVLSRSGYTTIMDLSKLGKKCFFIPTPGQYEQEYLAKKLQKEGLVPFSNQDDFRIERLLEVDLYKGLPYRDSQINWDSLFRIFERE